MEWLTDLIYAEGWQFFWLSWAISACIWCLLRCSTETVLVALMLLAGWFITNVFWQLELVYIISDLVFLVATFGLWLQSREDHILTVATLYGSMLVVHAISPPWPDYMVALNVLYGLQLAAVSRAAYRGAGSNARS